MTQAAIGPRGQEETSMICLVSSRVVFGRRPRHTSVTPLADSKSVGVVVHHAVSVRGPPEQQTKHPYSISIFRRDRMTSTPRDTDSRTSRRPRFSRQVDLNVLARRSSASRSTWRLAETFNCEGHILYWRSSRIIRRNTVRGLLATSGSALSSAGGVQVPGTTQTAWTNLSFDGGSRRCWPASAADHPGRRLVVASRRRGQQILCLPSKRDRPMIRTIRWLTGLAYALPP